MDNNRNAYIKTDENKIINRQCIRWIKKMDECFEICTKNNGCTVKKDTHRVCKYNSPDGYDKLNMLFE
jgi:hypothetical protein